jgi:hypothetical protein
VPLSYGYVWATGKRVAYYQLQNTGSSWMDYTRVGFWQLGLGEWDGPSELWINDKLTLKGSITSTTFAASASAPQGFSGQSWVAGLDSNPQFPALVFNFHSGCDSVIGSGLTPQSSGPDQGCDVLWAQFPPAIQPLCFTRVAYYGIMRKQAVANQTNNHRNDPTQWTDIAPVGLWRARRCRLFDDEGNQTGYAFTTNPIWHFVDLLLVRKIMPNYGLSVTLGPDALSTAVKNRFDWGAIYTAAQYCDEFLSNGRRRFMGSYSFVQQTSLQACQEQILLNCRAFATEYAGKIGVQIDMPRSSVFTFSREHILPGSWNADDQPLHKSGNHYIAHFRDLLVPECSLIESITCTVSGNPQVTTKKPHPFLAEDRIAIGGTGTVYDSEWQVNTVPAVENVGTVNEVDPTTFTMVSKGSNYPASVGTGGGCGLLYSRFKERAPIFEHRANQMARGVVGLGIARRREKVKQALDFATTTWDQASRIVRYERDRLLGIDQTPYVSPPSVKFRTSMFARDIYGNLVCAVRPGDHVTLDDTTNFQYAGEYEVLEPLSVFVPTAQASGAGGQIALKPQENSGEIEFALGPYNADIMYDTSDSTQAGWPSVPGSDPGNDTNYTQIALANGGVFVFFTGQLPSGQAFQLPSTGFSTSNLIAWAGPAGAVIKYHSASTVQLCSVSAARLLTLIYEDCSGNYTWSGDVNYAALSWLSTDATTTSNGLTWLELTLLGGETIIFGNGVLADGATIELPSGYSAAQSFAVAFPHDMTHSSHIMYMIGAYVDSNMMVHLNASDNNSDVWHGNASVLVFAWKNNMSTITTETDGGVSWMHCTLTDGSVFGVGCGKNMANGATFTLPSCAGDGSTLEVIVGSSDGTYVSGGNHAQGVGAAYLDADNIVHISFNDGSGDIWYGEADVFGLFCTTGNAVPTLISVSPATATVSAGAYLQFTATVQNNANTNVTWSVDGIAGGSVTVGTVSAAGLYTAPSSSGTHTIVATSSASSTATGSATVTVYQSASSGGYTINGA